MNIKAALLSGLVCPGLGQLSEKLWLKGLAMMIPAIAITVIILKQVYEAANIIAQRIVSGEIAPNLLQVQAEVHKAISQDQSQTMSILLAVFVLIWLVSVIDGLMIDKTKTIQKEPVSD